MESNIFQTIFDNFGIIVAIIVLVVCSIIVIRFAVTFDVNKYLESRKKRHLAIARNLCPHMKPKITKKEAGFELLLFKPFGTFNSHCTRCGAVFEYIDMDDFQKQVDYYISNPKAYQKRIKQYNKHMKKAQ